MSMMMRAARVHAWLNGRSYLLPEDIQGVFRETIAHRIFLAPVYEIRRESIMETLVDEILAKVPAP
jgi:MoxR-like ATPase